MKNKQLNILIILTLSLLPISGFSGAFGKVESDYPQQASNGNKGKNKSGKYKSLPPGLAKKAQRGEPLPPGWQKKIAKGEVLPYDIYEVSRKLPNTKGVGPNEEILQVEDKVVKIIKDTREIIDILK